MSDTRWITIERYHRRRVQAKAQGPESPEVSEHRRSGEQTLNKLFRKYGPEGTYKMLSRALRKRYRERVAAAKKAREQAEKENRKQKQGQQKPDEEPKDDFFNESELKALAEMGIDPEQFKKMIIPKGGDYGGGGSEPSGDGAKTKDSDCGANTGPGGQGFGTGNTCAVKTSKKVPVKVDDNGNVHDGPDNLKGRNLKDISPDEEDDPLTPNELEKLAELGIDPQQAKQLASEGRLVESPEADGEDPADGGDISFDFGANVEGGNGESESATPAAAGSGDEWEAMLAEAPDTFESEEKKNKGTFKPRTQLEKQLVEEFGDDPDVVQGMKRAVNDAYQIHRQFVEESNDTLRELLSHFGFTGKRLSWFMSAVRRAKDHDDIPKFDEMAQVAESTYPTALYASVGADMGKYNDAEEALFDRLQRGFLKPLPKYSDEIFKQAKDMVGWTTPYSVLMWWDATVDRYAYVNFDDLMVDRYGRQQSLFGRGEASDRGVQQTFTWVGPDGQPHCGANVKGGGGFQEGNTCAGSGKSRGDSADKGSESSQGQSEDSHVKAVDEARKAVEQFDLRSQEGKQQAIDKVKQVAEKAGVNPNELWAETVYATHPEDITGEDRDLEPDEIVESTPRGKGEPPKEFKTEKDIKDAYDDGFIDAEQALNELEALQQKSAEDQVREWKENGQLAGNTAEEIKEKANEGNTKAQRQLETLGEAASDRAESPRDQAQADQYYEFGEYEWAKNSEVKNAGEDLKGSARHRRNAWRSLEEAEREGTAEKWVTRNQLLKADGYTITDQIAEDKSNIGQVLALHLAVKKFPAKPKLNDGWQLAAIRAGEFKSKEEYQRNYRRQYLDEFRGYRDKAVELAADDSLEPELKVRQLQNYLEGRLKELRNTNSALHNQLVSTYNSLGYRGKTSVLNQWRRFTENLRGVNENAVDVPGRMEGGKPSITDPEFAHDYAMRVIEGKSVDGAFDKSSGGKRQKKFHPSEAYVEHVSRTGGASFDPNDHRANTSFLTERAGLRGIQFGNSMTDRERQHHLAKTAEAFSDLAEATGIPIEAISINGKLGMAFGARGIANALAHYEPGNHVINLTRRSGAGSLAHEWAHFMDHLLGGGKTTVDWVGGKKKSVGTFASRRGTDSAVADTMKELRKVWETSGFKERVQGEGDLGGYWSSDHEMFARSFERYIQKKLRDFGRENTYLAGLKESGHKLWPTDQEVDAMAPHFEQILSHFRDNVDRYMAIFDAQWRRYAALNTFHQRHQQWQTLLPT